MLPTSSAAAQGVDPGAVRALVEAWEAGDVRPFALTVVRHGHVVVDATWAPYVPGDLVQKYSVSKTFTAAAVGLAVAEGVLDVRAPVASYFPQVTGLGPRAAAMTVEHLLTMTTGHTVDTGPRLDPDDVVGSFLRAEPEADPGTVFTYDNAATVMLSALVQQVTGEALHDWLRPRLFDPLGIHEPGWLTVGPYDQGWSGLLTTTQAVARLGQTLLGRGEYAGTRVLPADWVDVMMAVHTATDQPGTGEQPDQDSALGYGYQMWRSQHGWRGIGAAGQLCLVLPDHDLVLAACAQTAATQPMLDAVWEHLLPGVGDPSPADVATRGIPLVAAHDAPDAQAADEPTEGADERGESDGTAQPDTTVQSDGTAQPDAAVQPDGTDDSLTGFFANRALPTIASTAPPDPGRRQLRAVGPAASMVAASGHVVVRDGHAIFEDASGGVLVVLGDGHWERTLTTLPDDTTVATAGTGGWTAPDVLEARIVPLCSPHVLEVRADVAAGTADLRWQVEPVGTLTLTRWL